MYRIDATSSRELQAIILAMRQADKEILTQIRQQTKGAVAPMLQQTMAEHASTRLEHRALVANARTTVSNQNITFSAGKVGRRLRGGLLPKQSAHAVEFGGDRTAKRTYEARSTRGRSFKVTRRTQAQLRPRRKSGYVFYQAVAEIVPRVCALWVQTVVRTFAEGLEGKRG